MGWYAAKAFCEKKGGYLATITSQSENDFVWGNLASKSPNSGGTWLGATNDKSGVYKWITGEAWSYTNWATGEPNNAQVEPNGGESYVSFFDPATKGKWIDIGSYNQGVLHADGFRKISTVCEWVGGNSSSF
jgi:hypothetical protein